MGINEDCVRLCLTCGVFRQSCVYCRAIVGVRQYRQETFDQVMADHYEHAMDKLRTLHELRRKIAEQQVWAWIDRPATYQFPR